MATATTSARTRRARFEPLGAERVAPGMVAVTNTRSGSTYTVDLREGVCECEDYQYRMGPADGQCKHLRFVALVEAGELCPRCGYATCRPSCPERSTTEEDDR